MSGPPKIVLTDVAKSFGDTVVLDGVNLQVESGESIAVIGQSGTGKSTMASLYSTAALERGYVERGQRVVVTAGLPMHTPRTTNSLRVETI